MTLASRLLSLFTISSVAVLIGSLQSTPVAALSIDSHVARGLTHHAHDALAKRKRSTKGKRCKPRPASSSAAASPSAAPSPSPVVHSSSAAAAAAPSSSPSSGGNIGSGKAGLGWANGNQFLDQWKGVKHIYTWAPECPSDAQKLGISCCPMIWGWDQVGRWQSEVMGTSPPCVMGPNEPEIAGQSNMDAGSGVALWNQYVRPMKQKGAILISPATTSDPAGKQWMIDFYRICGGNNCDVAKHAVHWYDVGGDKLIQYLTDIHNTFKLPLWLTEFACQNFNDANLQCTMDEVWAFQNKVTAFMTASDFVEMYMPFGAMQNMQGVNPDNQLMDANGNPNALAKAYLGI